MGLGNKSFSHENRFQQDAESTVNAGFYAEKERGKKQTHTHTQSPLRLSRRLKDHQRSRVAPRIPGLTCAIGDERDRED